MKTEPLFYRLVATAFGPLGLVWWETAAGPRVRQAFLDKKQTPPRPMEEVIRERYPTAQAGVCPEIAELGEQIQRFLAGEAVVFSLARVALERCGEFQRKVLLAEYGIPRGWVSTYGRLAAVVGCPGGGRAVGRALAENPFPILIPCHRAVQAGGGIGGYQGGPQMKRALLEREGVLFTTAGKVLMQKVYYAPPSSQAANTTAERAATS
jgi:methylated-DNA-[protein]-cysteine S-methyltransferase